LTLDPDYVDINVPPGQGVSFDLAASTGAQPGTVVCFDVMVHDGRLGLCCTERVCVTVPCCMSPDPCVPDETIHVGWDRRYCANKDFQVIPATVCNYGSTVAEYDVTSLVPLPVGSHGGQCTQNPGTLSYTVSGVPVEVQPGQCRTIDVVIHKPAGLNLPSQSVCYKVTATNLKTGSTFNADGSLLGAGGKWCADDPEPPVVMMVDGGAGRELTFEVRSPVGTGGVISYTVHAAPSDMVSPNTSISLDGNPPGQDVTGMLQVPPGGTGSVKVKASLGSAVHLPFAQRENGPDQTGGTTDMFRLHDVLLLADIDGDGVQEVLTSVGLIASRSRSDRTLYLPAVQTPR
jgi:hypothetical protein